MLGLVAVVVIGQIFYGELLWRTVVSIGCHVLLEHVPLSFVDCTALVQVLQACPKSHSENTICSPLPRQ